MSEFPGFPAGCLSFFDELLLNNNRDWFNEHREAYRKLVQQPAQALVMALGERLTKLHPDLNYSTALNGSGSIFRIHRDLRFSKDKTPYKTHLGILFWVGSGGGKMSHPGYYFHLQEGLGRLHAGRYMMDPKTLTAMRKAVLDLKQGNQLKAIFRKLERAGYEIGPPHYKRMPRGCDPDHPHADLLRHRSIVAHGPRYEPDILTSPELVDALVDSAKTLKPLIQWLSEKIVVVPED